MWHLLCDCVTDRVTCNSVNTCHIQNCYSVTQIFMFNSDEIFHSEGNNF